MKELVAYNPQIGLAEQTYNAVMQLEDIEALYKLQNTAAAARNLAKQAKEPKIVWNYCMATAIWARWKIGQLFHGKVYPGQPQKESGHNDRILLASIDVDENESKRWQLLARIPEQELSYHIASYDKTNGAGAASTLTFNSCYKLLPKPGAPPGTYDVIVIDPPWEMKIIERLDAPNQEDIAYPTMTIEELIEWGSKYLKPAPDCHFFLWTTNKYLPRAFDLLSAWGFKYICTFVWHKPGGFQPFELPQYNCEFALYAHKGTPRFTNTKDFKICFDAPRGEHSEKPDYFYDMVRRVTDGNRIDMFARRERSGFDIWGNEI